MLIDWLTSLSAEGYTALFSGLLFVATAILAVFTYLLWTTTQKAIVDTERSLIVARESTEAARDAADSARKQVDMTRRSMEPLLYLSVRPNLQFWIDNNGESRTFAQIDVSNHGQSPAEITRAFGLLAVAKTPQTPVELHDSNINDAIVGKNDTFERLEISATKINLSTDRYGQLVTVPDGERLYLQCFIYYNGPESREHFIKACWCWTNTYHRFHVARSIADRNCRDAPTA